MSRGSAFHSDARVKLIDICELPRGVDSEIAILVGTHCLVAARVETGAQTEGAALEILIAIVLTAPEMPAGCTTCI
jgi:hypothetical protein